MVPTAGWRRVVVVAAVTCAVGMCQQLRRPGIERRRKMIGAIVLIVGRLLGWGDGEVRMG